MSNTWKIIIGLTTVWIMAGFIFWNKLHFAAICVLYRANPLENCLYVALQQ